MFSDAVLTHVANPHHAGPLDGATHYGVAGTLGDGPYMEMWLRIESGQVRRAAYRSYPCPAAIACGSPSAELASGTVGRPA